MYLTSVQVGISQRRVEWVLKWCDRLLNAGAVNTSELEEGVGRLSFVAGILDFPRPWLAPLFMFLARSPRGSIVALPAYVKFALKYLAYTVADARLVPCARRPLPLATALRVDAHAEGARAGVGAWLPHLDGDGNIVKELSPWLSVSLDASNAPWAFSRGGEGFRTIASLEAFAIVLGIKFLLKDTGDVGDRWRHLTVIPALTDNQSNGRTLTKVFTTKYPLAAVVMELGEELRCRGLWSDVRWVPRASNEEADALSRGVTTGFADQLRARITLSEVPWRVFNEALSWGDELGLGPAQLRAGRGQGHELGRGKRRRRGERLRDRDPW